MRLGERTCAASYSVAHRQSVARLHVEKCHFSITVNIGHSLVKEMSNQSGLVGLGAIFTLHSHFKRHHFALQPIVTVLFEDSQTEGEPIVKRIPVCGERNEADAQLRR